MRAKEIIARARDYERLDGFSPADALLSVLIDFFTNPDTDGRIEPQAVQQAWEKLSRDLDVPQWLTESQSLSDGIDILAANLTEVQRHDWAAALRAISQPRFEGAVRSPAAEIERLHQLEDQPEPADDARLWVPRTVSHGV